MIETIIRVLSYVNAAYFSLLIFFGLFGIWKFRTNYPLLKDKYKFVIIVPSHNEMNIISATIKNLSTINYDSSKYDIFILADNCKDQTATRARETIIANNLKNFHVLERFEKDPMKRGKPHALRWAIDSLERENRFYSKYDFFLILDADNFVQTDLLQHFNSHYLSFNSSNKPVMIQCYLDCKNTRGLIAKGYHISYRILNRFNQLGRSRLNLNAMIGGTGFIMDMAFLKSIGGFKAKSLTEDLEIQTIATLMNKRIAYNHHIRIFDEKPTRIVASYIQKTRWSQGHWWNFFHYGPKALWNSLTHIHNPGKFLRSLDNFIYLSIMVNYVFLFFVFFLGFIQFIFGLGIDTTGVFYWNFGLFAISFFIFYPAAVLQDGTALEKKSFLIEWIPNYFSFVFSSFIYLFSGLTGLFKFRNQHTWVKTKHSINHQDSPHL
jgi:cellulose synthase/poly-beta-1,6-N-acetylglucosamine synthase-like glycosyltransferase